MEIQVKIILNGKDHEVRQGITISELLEEMKIVPETVACELNQAIARRKDYTETIISEGDRIEFLQMIGGG